jgi:hypothetical protein
MWSLCYCRCKVMTYSAIRRSRWIVVACGQPVLRSFISRSMISPHTGTAELSWARTGDGHRSQRSFCHARLGELLKGSLRRKRPHRQPLLTSARHYPGRAGDQGKIRQPLACQRTRHGRPPICRQPVKQRLPFTSTSQPFVTWPCVERPTVLLA